MSREVVAILYCHNSLISLVGLDCQRKPLMRTDVKRREIWEWSDHTLWTESRGTLSTVKVSVIVEGGGIPLAMVAATGNMVDITLANRTVDCIRLPQAARIEIVSNHVYSLSGRPWAWI
jgi:hypothetical protein